MFHFFYITLYFFLSPFSYEPADPGSTITEKTILYDLAGNIVPIKIQQYRERNDLVFISLHDDETTSVGVAKRILDEHGGVLIKIENNSQRNIRFKLGRHFYKVDPNTIFSEEGIKRSLGQFGRSSDVAVDEVAKLGLRIIQLIPAEAKCIVALHNNTPGFYSVTEYAAGNKRANDSKKVYINENQDADDFFLTTDNAIYKNLVEKGYNAVLQDSKHCAEDGSLSVYCGRKNMRYINCETEHGKNDQYFEMMRALIAVIHNP